MEDDIQMKIIQDIRKVFVLIIALLVAVHSGVIADNKENGPIIDTVTVTVNNIFDTDTEKFDYWYFRLANRLHIKTKKFVVAREILMKPGESYNSDLAEETVRNLRSLPYIYEAEAFLDTVDGKVRLNVVTSDRWTLAGGPQLDRSEGQNTLTLGFEELNVLGLGQQLEADYFIREFEENYLELSFFERRLLNSRHSFYLYHNGDPEVGLNLFRLSRPYYQLNDRFSWSTSYTFFDRIDRYYVSGFEVSRNDFEGRRTNLSLNYRFGEYLSKVRFGVGYQYNDMRVSNRQVLIEEVPTVFPTDSVYHSATATFEISRLKYFETHRIDRFKRTEDISLRNSVALSLGWHYDGRSRNLLYRTVSFTGNLARYWKSNLLFGSISRTYWLDGPVKLRKTTSASLVLYNNYLKFLTPVLQLAYSIDDRRERRLSLAVGEDNGVRGYPRDYITGEKLFRINYESRFFTGISIMSAEIGAVQFIDGAQGMLRDQPISFDRIKWAYGIGLRIGSEKIGNADIMRIDLAYADAIDDWQISFGVGQYF